MKEPNQIEHPELIGTVMYSQEELRQAAGRFSRGTAESFDGLHVRHWRMFDPPERLLERMVHLMVVQGRIPRAMQGMIGTMLPKATAGYRSVVLFHPYIGSS